MAEGLTTEVLSTHTPALFATAVARAVAVLERGHLAALPTETVYGLAANALRPEAVHSIFAVKGRPHHNPIIVHIAGREMARQCSAAWPQAAERLARAFWPGPLTLVLPKASHIPNAVTAGGSTVGLRWPSHPLMQAVIRACGFPLAAPSANLSSRISPTTAEHVRQALDGRIPLIVDGGPCNVGIESTVLDLTTDPPRVLRPGSVTAESLAAVLGPVDTAEGRHGETLKSPGLLEKHYAPQAALRLLSWRDDADLRRQLRESRAAPAPVQTNEICVLAHTVIPSAEGFLRVSVIPHDPEAFARALYAELHHCDAAGAKAILVEALPPAPAWQAVADRLRRAAARTAASGS